MNLTSIPRNRLLASLRAALLGPRQCGKTTLARDLAGERVSYFDLEDPADAMRLEQAATALASLKGLVVVDEIQRLPSLFPVLMLAHYHGGVWSASEIGRSLGLAHTTVRHHLDILEGAMMVRVLQPWHANVASAR